ncbi:MAG: hypothetical protein KDD44_12410 [Bdellovibrionales bacterium]|nr:hypothetical protein [Nitrospira sp.]MCB0360439.1 hypothetical protein [Bdellovibrionales bacterium]
MTGFNRMTIVAAAEVISDFKTHSEMEIIEVQWRISPWVNDKNLAARAASWARLAIDQNPKVLCEAGEMDLCRALVETALQAPPKTRRLQVWKKLVAGLRFDGFEIAEAKSVLESRPSWMGASVNEVCSLVRMLPEDVPGLDFREAENEITLLLDELGFVTAKGHLKQALSAFQRGEWSSANGEFRNFFEGYLNAIADDMGYTGAGSGKDRRDFLGSAVTPPFLLTEYNEWDPQKTQFVQALMNRMHPHGGHPGLSDEEDSAFRLQVTLTTARLFLRRYQKRKAATQ